MAIRKPKAETQATEPTDGSNDGPAKEVVAPVERRRYRALETFEVEVGENRLLFNKGRAFTTDSIPFDPRLMEPLD